MRVDLFKLCLQHHSLPAHQWRNSKKSNMHQRRNSTLSVSWFSSERDDKRVCVRNNLSLYLVLRLLLSVFLPQLRYFYSLPLCRLQPAQVAVNKRF